MGPRVRGLAVLVLVLVTGAVLGSWGGQWFAGAAGEPDARTALEPLTPWGDRVRVEVLNGGGKPGMARSATTRLRDRRFDVVEIGNKPGFGVDTSEVLVRTDHLEEGRRAAEVLGIDRVRVEEDANLFVDLTVVLGTDWSPASVPVDPARSPAAWWDLRRFLRRPQPDGAVPGIRWSNPVPLHPDSSPRTP